MSQPLAELAPDHTHNLDVERACIAVVLDGRNAGAWDTLIGIVQTPVAFFDRTHRIIILGCMMLAAEGAVINTSTACQTLSALQFQEAVRRLREMDGLTGKLPPLGIGEPCAYEDSALAAAGGYNVVSDLTAGASPTTSLERLARTIAEHHRQRLAIAVFSKAVDELRMPQGVRKVGEIIDMTLNAALAQTSAGGSQTLGDGARDALTLHDARQSGQVCRSAVFGLPSLDQAVHMQPGELWILAAAPGCGKTSLLLHALTATARAYGKGTVALVSREMGRRELGTIVIARGLRCTRQQVEHGRLDPGQREMATELAAKIDELGVQVRDSTGGCNVADVSAWAKSHKRLKPGLALLAIDYLQILTGTNPKQSEYERVSEATAKLKQLARDLDLPILALSQMSREGRKAERGKGGVLKNTPEPQLGDLRGSGSIEQDADGVIFLWKPVDDGVIIEAKVAKNRAGALSRTELLWYPAQGQRFAEVPRSVESEPHHNTTMFTPPSANPADEIMPWERP